MNVASDANQSNSNDGVSSISAAIIGIAGVIAGAIITASVEYVNGNSAAFAAGQQRALEIARYKGEILSSLNKSDAQTAEVLLVHTLRPIDAPEAYSAFYEAYQGLLAQRTAQRDTDNDRKLSLVPLSVPPTAKVPSAGTDGSDLRQLVNQFAGSGRQEASRLLLAAYEQRPSEVVHALIDSILPHSQPAAYRVNLYIALTLANVPGRWRPLPSQCERLIALEGTPLYDDPTFRDRLNEAVARAAGGCEDTVDKPRGR